MAYAGLHEALSLKAQSSLKAISLQFWTRKLALSQTRRIDTWPSLFKTRHDFAETAMCTILLVFFFGHRNFTDARCTYTCKGTSRRTLFMSQRLQMSRAFGLPHPVGWLASLRLSWVVDVPFHRGHFTHESGWISKLADTHRNVSVQDIETWAPDKLAVKACNKKLHEGEGGRSPWESICHKTPANRSCRRTGRKIYSTELCEIVHRLYNAILPVCAAVAICDLCCCQC